MTKGLVCSSLLLYVSKIMNSYFLYSSAYY